MRAVDFFCGAGGLTRGLRDASIEIVAGIDADASCRQSYEHNNRGSRFIDVPIERIDAVHLRTVIGTTVSDDLLFAGCAPCQPFSSQKKQKRREPGSKDAVLLGEFARLVEEFLPGTVMIENVPGLTRVKGFSTYRRFVSMLSANGYSFVKGVVDAKDFGAPQSRKRFILLASRVRAMIAPTRTHGVGHVPHKTVRDAIQHYPPLTAGETHPIIANHQAASLSDLNLRRLKATPPDGGDRRAWSEELVLVCHKGKYQGHTDVYGRMFWDKPAPTLTGKCNSLSNGRYGHPEQDRAISLREAASLQTFPDSYRFFGGQREIAQQIGNAVPVALGQALGRHILGTQGDD